MTNLFLGFLNRSLSAAVLIFAVVLVRLAAVRSALDNTGKVILKDHLRHCMVDAVEAGDQEAIEELCVAIDKLMK